MLATEMRKPQILLNKPVYLGLTILDLRKTNVWILVWLCKTKIWQKCKALDTDRFIVHVKTDDFYKKIVQDIQTRLDTSNFELGRPLPKGKSKKVIGLMEDE